MAMGRTMLLGVLALALGNTALLADQQVPSEECKKEEISYERSTGTKRVPFGNPMFDAMFFDRWRGMVVVLPTPVASLQLWLSGSGIITVESRNVQDTVLQKLQLHVKGSQSLNIGTGGAPTIKRLRFFGGENEVGVLVCPDKKD